MNDNELDLLLTSHRSDANIDTAALTTARTRLLAVASTQTQSPPEMLIRHERTPLGSGPSPRRVSPSWRIGLVAAAVAVLLAGIMFAVPATVRNSADAAAVTLLDQAASVTASDPVIPAGQYLYMETHAHSLSIDMGEGHVTSISIDESLIQTWRPAIWTDQWTRHSQVIGRTWIVEPATREPLNTAVGKLSAPCGGFYSAGCSQEGSWQTPTPKFMAALPRDPEQLLERLKNDAPNNGRGNAELVVYVADILRNGLVPADLRVSLYQTLSLIEGVQITEELANLDGRVGTAIGIVDPSGRTRQDIIIDPATGMFIGEREVTLRNDGNIPAGTVTTASSVRTVVVPTVASTG